mmetsp:Transcript_45735/g.74666  ORF Transcript_45735/g.74666 Transcript_45735/m.74666 type:complete len:141 (-) Transcript_45735:1475-1897(-)
MQPPHKRPARIPSKGTAGKGRFVKRRHLQNQRSLSRTGGGTGNQGVSPSWSQRSESPCGLVFESHPVARHVTVFDRRVEPEENRSSPPQHRNCPDDNLQPQLVAGNAGTNTSHGLTTTPLYIKLPPTEKFREKGVSAVLC